MDGINRIIKSLEDSGVLNDGVTDTVRHEVGFHATISAPMLQGTTSDFFSSKRYCRKSSHGSRKSIV